MVPKSRFSKLGIGVENGEYHRDGLSSPMKFKLITLPSAYDRIQTINVNRFFPFLNSIEATVNRQENAPS